MGDYFAWRVSQVTYREHGRAEVWTELPDNLRDRGYSFEEEAEFDEYHTSYVAEGWRAPRGVTANKRPPRRPSVPLTRGTVVAIDLSGVDDAQALHLLFAEVFDFPDHYGRNWDAWIDCMGAVLGQGEVLTLRLLGVAGFAKQCPKLHVAFLECTAHVNARHPEPGGPALVLAF